MQPRIPLTMTTHQRITDPDSRRRTALTMRPTALT
jgi:hypothetical protein